MSSNSHYVYLLRCKDGSLYCGYALDVGLRAIKHNAGLGSKYVRSRGGGKVVYTERCGSKSEALKREAKIKRMSKVNKELLTAVKKVAI